MTADAHLAAEFYRSARGAVTARIVRDRIAALWPAAKGESVLGLGYAMPYLRLWHDQAQRCIAVTPAHLGAVRWPAGAPNLSCAAEEDSLPFADMSFDRILLVHGLEVAENARRLLREAWRVLKDDGRLLIIAPNRAGMWAYWDNTPFGHGLPYSTGQMNRLLTNSLFRVERREACLWLPPAKLRLLLRSAPLFERAGRKMVPGLAGVLLTEAVKDVYAAMPLKSAVRRRLVLADAA
jgi:SAM-dependent methyltransferase